MAHIYYSPLGSSFWPLKEDTNMIAFKFDNHNAIITNEQGDENGWVVEFDTTDNLFLVWETAERRILGGEDAACACRSLEEVLSLVNSYT